MIAGDKPFESDHIIKAIIEPQPGDLVIYNLQWSYIDQDDLQNRSWDDFLGNYGLDGVIQGRLDARCLLTPVDTPKELEDIIDEMRLCFAFGQITAVFALCRTLLESAITALQKNLWVNANRFDGGCAPPNPAPLAAAGVRGELG